MPIQGGGTRTARRSGAAASGSQSIAERLRKHRPDYMITVAMVVLMLLGLVGI
jgi:hypothetical protein